MTANRWALADGRVYRVPEIHPGGVQIELDRHVATDLTETFRMHTRSQRATWVRVSRAEQRAAIAATAQATRLTTSASSTTSHVAHSTVV